MFLNMDYATPSHVDDVTQDSVTTSLKFGRKVLRTNAQRWDLTLTLKPDVRGAQLAAANLQVHMSEHGYHTPFSLLMLQHLGVVAPVLGAGKTVSGTGKAGSSTLTLSNGAPTIPKGLFFRLAGDTKVYLAQSQSSASIKVYPALRKDVTAAKIDLTPDLYCLYSRDFLKRISYVEGVVNRFTIIVEEVV